MKRSEARIEFLGDVITTAVEGGTGYWAQVSQYQYTYDGEVKVYAQPRIGDETHAILHEMNDDETGYKAKGLKLDLDAVARGIGLIQRDEVGVADSYRERILAASRENDAGLIDADDADVIVQAGLLGEIRYG